MKKILAALFVILAASYQLACNKSATPTQSGSPTISGAAVTAYSTMATGLANPYGIVVDKSGNAYVSEYDNGDIIKITPAGVKSVFATGFHHVRRLAIDAAGNIYVCDPKNGALKMVSSAGFVTTLIQNPFGDFRPRGVALGNGTVYVTGGYRFPMVWTLKSGVLTPFAGSSTPGYQNGPAASALFSTCSGVAVNPLTGDVYVCDPHNSSGNGYVRKISGGQVSNFVTSLNRPSGIVVDSHGNVVFSERTAGNIWSVAPNGTKTLLGSSYNNPYGVFVDSNGKVYVVENGTSSVKTITISTLP